MLYETFGLTLIAAPASEPVTLDEAKAQCRVELDNTYDDTYLNTLIVRARTWLEKAMGRRFINSTWDLTINDFGDLRSEIVLPYGPLSSVTSVKYLDSSGTQQTMSSSGYVVDTASFAGKIYPAYSTLWPIARAIQNAVVIRYVAGYGATASSVPQDIKGAILLLCAGWYDFRAEIVAGVAINKIPHAVNALLAMDKQSWL